MTDGLCIYLANKVSPLYVGLSSISKILFKSKIALSTTAPTTGTTANPLREYLHEAAPELLAVQPPPRPGLPLYLRAVRGISPHVPPTYPLDYIYLSPSFVLWLAL